MKVLFTEPCFYHEELRNSLPSSWNCDFQSFSSNDLFIAWIEHNPYDIIFASLGLCFGSEFFQSIHNLKIIATPTTGTDHIDLKLAHDKNVEVLSLRGEADFLGQITTTAEHAWSLLLACNRRLPALYNQTREGSWSRQNLILHQLSGTTLGIIGLGRLGKIVAEYAHSFRMTTLAYDPYIISDKSMNNIAPVSLEQLLKESDHVILTASYNPGDNPIISNDQISIMKPESTFVNVSRGELVDEFALIEGIKKGILRSVGVDVLPGDSSWDSCHKISSPLLDFAKTNPNIIITPHVGGYAVEAIAATRQFIVQKVLKYLGEQLR